MTAIYITAAQDGGGGMDPSTPGKDGLLADGRTNILSPRGIFCVLPCNWVMTLVQSTQRRASGSARGVMNPLLMSVKKVRRN